MDSPPPQRRRRQGEPNNNVSTRRRNPSRATNAAAATTIPPNPHMVEPARTNTFIRAAEVAASVISRYNDFAHHNNLGVDPSSTGNSNAQQQQRPPLPTMRARRNQPASSSTRRNSRSAAAAAAAVPTSPLRIPEEEYVPRAMSEYEKRMLLANATFLPENYTPYTDIDDDGEQDESRAEKCTICQCLFEPKDHIVIPNCLHKIHVTCLSTLLNHDVRCPICRIELFARNDDFPPP